MTVLLVRPSHNEQDSAALAQYGVATVEVPLLEVLCFSNPTGVQAIFNALMRAREAWLIIGSRSAASHFLGQLSVTQVSDLLTNPRLRVGAVGSASAEPLQNAGFPIAKLSAATNFESLIEEILAEPLHSTTSAASVVGLPHGNLAAMEPQQKLKTAGFEVVAAQVYENRPRIPSTQEATELRGSGIDAVLLRSGSAADAYLAIEGLPKRDLICVGATAERVVRSTGLRPALIIDPASPERIAERIARFMKVTND